MQFVEIELPARRAYKELRQTRPEAGRFLVVCGYWGQGPIIRVTREILNSIPNSKVDVVCGENLSLREQACQSFDKNPRVTLHGCVESMLPLMRDCAAIITKPGISTLLEADVLARRKLFLLRGMPVAEDNNARYAIRNFGAEWFSVDSLHRWTACQEG